MTTVDFKAEVEKRRDEMMADLYSLLEIEERFRPEVLITVGYAAEKVEPSYRLPVDEIIEKR